MRWLQRFRTNLEKSEGRTCAIPRRPIRWTREGNNMTISRYDKTIAPHLQAAQEWAYRAAREIDRLPERPRFFTLAQDELNRAETKATQLLATIKSAKQQYAAKPVEIV